MVRPNTELPTQSTQANSAMPKFDQSPITPPKPVDSQLEAHQQGELIYCIAKGHEHTFHKYVGKVTGHNDSHPRYSCSKAQKSFKEIVAKDNEAYQEDVSKFLDDSEEQKSEPIFAKTRAEGRGATFPFIKTKEPLFGGKHVNNKKELNSLQSKLDSHEKERVLLQAKLDMLEEKQKAMMANICTTEAMSVEGLNKERKMVKDFLGE